MRFSHRIKSIFTCQCPKCNIKLTPHNDALDYAGGTTTYYCSKCKNEVYAMDEFTIYLTVFFLLLIAGCLLGDFIKSTF